MASNQEATAIFVIEEEDETARRGFSFEKKQKSSSESSDIRELFFPVTPKPRARQRSCGVDPSLHGVSGAIWKVALSRAWQNGSAYGAT